MERVQRAIHEGLESLGHSPDSAPEVVSEMLWEFQKHILGGTTWSADTRKFFRHNRGDEEAVDVYGLDRDLKLSQLGDRGITLGGNCWVLILQMLENRYPNTKDVVVAHKNTRSGANYSLPLLVSSNTKAYVSPIVRVIPNGQESLTGDGLDIGAYILYPQLSDNVSRAFEQANQEVIGGKRKLVIEITGAPPVASFFTEPSDNGIDKKARKPVVIL